MQTPEMAIVVKSIQEISEISRGVAITGESLLVEEMGLDSLDLVSVIMQVQEELGVELDLDAVGSLKCVGDLLSLIERATPARAA